MFAWIKYNWREARGIELAKQFKTIVRILRELPPDGRKAFAHEALLQIETWEKTFKAAPDGMRRRILKAARQGSKEQWRQGFYANSMAVDFVACVLEAGYLPGGAPRLILNDASDFFQAAYLWQQDEQKTFNIPKSMGGWDPLHPLFKEAMREMTRRATGG